MHNALGVQIGAYIDSGWMDIENIICDKVT